MWFCLACFGAATPPRSMFYSWLAMLGGQPAYENLLEDVLRSLPRPGERPFVAALPQAALANPEGPLAVIGHSDLAWVFGFAEGNGVSQSRASRIVSVLEVLANGSRAGVALDALMSVYRDVNDGLMADYQTRQDALTEGRRDPVEPEGMVIAGCSATISAATSCWEIPRCGFRSGAPGLIRDAACGPARISHSPSAPVLFFGEIVLTQAAERQSLVSCSSCTRSSAVARGSQLGRCQIREVSSQDAVTMNDPRG